MSLLQNVCNGVAPQAHQGLVHMQWFPVHSELSLMPIGIFKSFRMALEAKGGGWGKGGGPGAFIIAGNNISYAGLRYMYSKQKQQDLLY